MLIDFTFENFRSIKEPVTLSAVAQRSKARKEPRIIPDDEIAPPHHVDGWDFGLLPALGIFGANASGKSNVLLALNFLASHIKFGMPYGLTGLQPFLLDEEVPARRARFEIRLALESGIYAYALETDREVITHESLTHATADTKRERRLYTRDWDVESSADKWTIGPHFAGPHMQLKDNLDRHSTFLGLLFSLQLPHIMPVRRWVLEFDGCNCLGLVGNLEPTLQRCRTSPDLLDRISRVIRQLDTGVSELVMIEPQESVGGRVRIGALHKVNGIERTFVIENESSGTQALFALVGSVLRALDFGSLLIIDELGSNTHPHITHELVRMFQNPRINTNGAQLIFASHDNTLMSNHLLRRDQIWFTEKGVDGATKLFPLSDFKPRNDLAMDWAYMDGRYGGVPILAGEEELVSAIRE